MSRGRTGPSSPPTSSPLISGSGYQYAQVPEEEALNQTPGRRLSATDRQASSPGNSMGSLEDPSHGEVLRKVHSRRTTDLCGLCGFLLYFAGMVGITVSSFRHGDPRRLYHSFDYSGQLCGIDSMVLGKNLIYWPKPESPSYPICIDRCPGDSMGTVLFPEESAAMSQSGGEERATVTSKEVRIHTYPTRQVGARLCLPLALAEAMDRSKPEPAVTTTLRPSSSNLPVDALLSPSLHIGPIAGLNASQIPEPGLAETTAEGVAQKEVQGVPPEEVNGMPPKVQEAQAVDRRMEEEEEEKLKSPDESPQHEQSEHEKPDEVVMYRLSNLIRGQEQSPGTKLRDAVMDVADATPIVLLGGALAAFAGFTYLLFMKHCARPFAFGVLGMLILACISMAVYCLAYIGGDAVKADQLLGSESQNPVFLARLIGWSCVALGVVLLGLVLVFYTTMQRSLGCIEASCEAIWDQPALLRMPSVELIVKTLFTLAWTVAFSFVATSGNITAPSLDVNGTLVSTRLRVFASSDLQKFYVLYYIIGYIWGLETLGMIFQFTVSFCTVSWYFTPCRNDMTKTQVDTKLWRKGTIYAFRYHLGSLALGAAMTSLFRPIHGVMAMIAKQHKFLERHSTNVVVANCMCCVWCFEEVVRYINNNAIVYMVLNSGSFFGSAGSAVKTLSKAPKEINSVNGITGNFHSIGLLAVASLIAYFAFATLGGLPMFSSQDSTWYVDDRVAAVICTGLLAAGVSSCFMALFDVVFDSLLFCWLADTAKGEVSFAPKSLQDVLGDPRTRTVQPEAAVDVEAPDDEAGLAARLVSSTVTATGVAPSSNSALTSGGGEAPDPGLVARRAAEVEERERLAQKKEAARRKEAAARKAAEEEEAARKSAQESRKVAEQKAAREAAEKQAAAQKAQADTAKAAEEETTRKEAAANKENAEAEARRAAEKEAARKAAEQEAAAKEKAEAEARKAAEQEAAAKEKAEAEARKAAEEDAARKVAEKAAAKDKAEAEARKVAEEAAAAPDAAQSTTAASEADDWADFSSAAPPAPAA